MLQLPSLPVLLPLHIAVGRQQWHCWVGTELQTPVNLISFEAEAAFLESLPTACTLGCIPPPHLVTRAA